MTAVADPEPDIEMVIEEREAVHELDVTYVEGETVNAFLSADVTVMVVPGDIVTEKLSDPTVIESKLASSITVRFIPFTVITGELDILTSKAAEASTGIINKDSRIVK